MSTSLLVNTPEQPAPSPAARTINPRKRKAESPAPRYELRGQRKSTYTDMYEHIDDREGEEAAVSVGNYEEEENSSTFTPDDKSLKSEGSASSGETEDSGSDMDRGAIEDEDSDVTGNSGGKYEPM